MHILVQRGMSTVGTKNKYVVVAVEAVETAVFLRFNELLRCCEMHRNCRRSFAKVLGTFGILGRRFNQTCVRFVPISCRRVSFASC